MAALAPGVDSSEPQFFTVGGVSLPAISQSLFQTLNQSGYQSALANYNAQKGSEGPYATYTNTAPDPNGIYTNAQSLLGDAAGNGAPYSNSSNYSIVPQGDGGFGIEMKTGDKQGTVVPYALQNGQYVPQTTGLTNQYWNTSQGNAMEVLAPLAVVGGAAAAAGGILGAGAGAASAGSGAGGAAAGGASIVPSTADAALSESVVGSGGEALGAGGGAAGFGSASSVSLSDVNNAYKGYNVANNLINGPAKMTPTATNGGQGTAITNPDGSMNYGNLAGDLVAGGLGTLANGSTASSLTGMYNNAATAAAPAVNTMNNTIQNPQSYFNSNMYQSQAALYAQGVNAQKNAAGTTGNSIDYDQKMTGFAANSYDSYLQQLTSAANVGLTNQRAYAPYNATGAAVGNQSAAPFLTALGGSQGVGSLFNSLNNSLTGGSTTGVPFSNSTSANPYSSTGGQDWSQSYTPGESYDPSMVDPSTLSSTGGDLSDLSFTDATGGLF